MRLWRFLALFTCVINLASASVVVMVDFHYPKLALKDGREFKNVTVKSYDLVTERVTVLIDRSMNSWPIAWLPDEISARLNEVAPKVSAEDLNRERKALQNDKLADEKRAKARVIDNQKYAIKEQREIRKDARKLNTKRAEIEMTKVAQTPSDVAKVANDYARRYFNSATEPGMAGMISLEGDVDLSDPEPVPGWSGRWRVKGKSFNKYYHSQGGVSSRSRDFEILIQTKEHGKPEVVDFTLLR